MVVTKRSMARFRNSDFGIRISDRVGFTLVELLIVVAIMAIMIAIALPRFEDIGRGSKMRAAINELRSTIALSRQWAIANREDVYIVLPDDNTSLYNGLSTNDYTKALRSYAVYSRSRGYIKDWTYLPAGVYFLDQYNSEQADRPKLPDCIVSTKNVFRSETLYDNDDNASGTSDDRLPFPSATSPTKTINGLRFTAQGWAVLPSGGTLSGVSFDFYLVEAVALNISGNKIIKLVWKDNPVVWSIRINSMTGISRTIDCSQSQ